MSTDVNGTTVKTLALAVGIPVDRLIGQLQEAGIEATTENDVLTDQQKITLLAHLRQRKEVTPAPKQDISIADLQGSEDLVALNDLLTKSMAERTIQALIKDEDLQTVVDTIIERAATENQPLLAAAMLGRLAAVARQARAASIFERADQVFSDEPPPLSAFADGDQKQYAAQMLAHVSAPWVVDYRYREALAIDTADNARRELFAANLEQETSIADWIAAITRRAPELNSIGNVESRLKRIRRIFSTMRDVSERWRGEVGAAVGLRLAECLKAFLTGKLDDLEQPVLFEAVDYLLAILFRVIQLRFSMAFYAETYALLEQGKRTLGLGLWNRFISDSNVMPQLRVSLLETALVLARQNKSDIRIMAALNSAYTLQAQLISALKSHFSDVRDLDPDILEWWLRGEAAATEQAQEIQRFRSTEDEKLGELLIQVEGSREVMEKLSRAVLPLLENFDPVLAETVSRATSDYKEMAQLVRGMARMRRLTPTDDVGKRVEYNLRKHDMVGGHKSGIRIVHVVRDGVEKDFAGKRTILVKPWVKPEN